MEPWGYYSNGLIENRLILILACSQMIMGFLGDRVCYLTPGSLTQQARKLAHSTPTAMKLLFRSAARATAGKPLPQLRLSLEGSLQW